MDPVLCLLPSPLLGPACWRPVSDVLSDRGFTVTAIASGRAPRTGADVLAAYLAAIPADRDVVLVPHSNAGLFVPSLAAQRRVAGYVFVDAGLPLDGADRVPMIPASFYSMLAGQADEAGLLPPWTQWWDEDSVSELFPDAGTREAVEREQSRLPLSYFAESVAVPSGWAARPGAYLAFGDTYAAERAAAASRGWAVRTLPGEHLHMLVDPAEVAAAISDLIASLPAAG
jgi:hypothetical protein